MAKGNFPKKGTLMYALASCDWSDLTSAQIAEVLDVEVHQITSAIARLKKEYGIIVKYKRRYNGARIREDAE